MTLPASRRRRARAARRAGPRLVALALALCGALAPPPPARAQSAAPLTLDAVLQAAAAQHPLVDAARARVAAARGARRTAGALPNPVLTYWTESVAFPGQHPSTPLDRETQAYATLPLEFVFQRGPRVRAAEADVGAAAADLARARQTVALDAARAFYRVAEAQVAVDAIDDVRARLAELVTYNQARVREGKTAEADLIRTQVELDRTEATATLDRVELTRARAALAPYLGGASAPADTVRVAVDEPSGTPSAAPLQPVAALLATARTGRPDVIAARARVASAAGEAGYQRALTFRHLGATFGSKRTLGVTSMIAGLSLPLPLFDLNRGAVQQAAALQTAAEADLAWTERQAAAEVQGAYEAARSLTAQAARLRGTMLQRAEESRRIALAAYQEGALSLLQVLDASRTLADARQTYYRLLFAQRESLLALRAAVGDGVQPLSVPSTSSTSPRPAGLTGDRP